MTRRLLPGIALLAAVLSGVAGCGPSTPDAVPVASGDGPLGP